MRSATRSRGAFDVGNLREGVADESLSFRERGMSLMNGERSSMRRQLVSRLSVLPDLRGVRAKGEP